MPEPLSPERLAEIRDLNVDSCSADAPYNPDVWELEKARTDLLAEVDRRLPLEDVERFLKRERDEYEPRGECWNTVDDLLDCFRLHMVTGTPLTDPRPEEGPGDPSVGSPPLTEAEELRVEVDRLKAANARLVEERDLAVAHDRQPYPTQWAYDQACAALEKHRNRADEAESRIAEALDLASRLDPTSGHGRVRAFISDLRRALSGEAS